MYAICACVCFVKIQFVIFRVPIQHRSIFSEKYNPIFFRATVIHGVLPALRGFFPDKAWANYVFIVYAPLLCWIRPS
jgi:hypothetical protein